MAKNSGGARSSAKFRKVNRRAMNMLDSIRRKVTGPGRAVGGAVGDSLLGGALIRKNRNQNSGPKRQKAR